MMSLFFKRITVVSLFISSMLVSSLSWGQTQSVSVSFADLTKNINQVQRDSLIKNKKTNKVVNRYQNKSRSQVQTDKLIATKQKTNNFSLNSSGYEFAIFTAETRLITDDDQDGFYQGFSVTFDADYLRYDDYDQTTVYAELYLRKNNGPWLHYYTTESFVIHSDSSDDAFEVVTSLVEGYNTEYYDVLIDLYEVGYSDIVATYSSDDSNALYALPLESADYDFYEVIEEVYVEEGGSFSLLLLFALLILLLIRFHYKGVGKHN